MQAITIAIGKTGLSFFAQQYLTAKITGLLTGLKPPNRSIPIDQFSYGNVNDTTTISNMVVTLTGSDLNGYAPAFQSIGQALSDGISVILLNYTSGPFTADYAWSESYQWAQLVIKENGEGIEVPFHYSGSQSNNNSYAPSFTALDIQVIVQFAFNTAANAWQVSVQNTSGNATGETPNVPGNSVLQNQTPGAGCDYSSHVSDASAAAVDMIDFSTPINALISGILATIPGSGNLGNGILYDFSLGDAGLAFPNEDGIQMGVKGGASYNTNAFPGASPPSLPLPAPLADTDMHHLNMYVSNYELDALHWAYEQAGKLNLVINPQDLPDPAVLNVRSYTAMDATLLPYAAFVMQAQITQNNAPTTTFQTVYLFSSAVMTLLQDQLPANVYQQLAALGGSAYLSLTDLENFLTAADVSSTDFTAIENAGMVAAMVVSQDMTFNLTIQNGQPSLPSIQFGVQRVDVLTGLQLGISPDLAQTMQYGFANASNSVSYIGSSIPGFDGKFFSGMIWPVTAEALYAQNLADMGKTGVPLPIMQGFQFDFANAQLSVQDGYVSILANVQYNP